MFLLSAADSRTTNRAAQARNLDARLVPVLSRHVAGDPPHVIASRAALLAAPRSVLLDLAAYYCGAVQGEDEVLRRMIAFVVGIQLGPSGL